MTLSHAFGELDETSEYRVALLDRLRDLAPDQTLGSDMSLVYEWRAGYEKLTIRRVNGGGTEYGGSYHPNAVCEPYKGDGTRGAFVCRWCGSVCW